jgi:curved DNA-binding protein CbpA
MRVPSILPLLFCLDIVATRFSDAFAFLPTHPHSNIPKAPKAQLPNTPKAQQSHDRLHWQFQLSATAKATSTSTSDDDHVKVDTNTNNERVKDAVTLTVPADLKQTLYDVLGASPTHTRTELKKCYIAMAKKHHPDALISNKSNATDDDTDRDFSDIAAAWRLLQDPKQRRRYDRTLQAEQFSQDVTALFSKVHWGKQAPQAANLFESVAIPFIRRTTATTLASIQAAAQDLNQKQPFVVDFDVDIDNMDDNGTMDSMEYNDSDSTINSNSTAGTGSTNTTSSSGIRGNSTSASAVKGTDTATPRRPQPKQQQQPQRELDFSRAFRSAVAAAQRAGRYVDSMELTEKSERLLARARQGAQEAADLQEESQKLATVRLQMVLHTPGSGLTSADAALVLEDFNNTVTNTDLYKLTMLDHVLLKTTVSREIQELQKYELGFVETQAIETRDQREYQKNVLARLKAKSTVVAALKREEELRKELEEAQKHVAESKQALDVVFRNFTVAEQVCRKSQHEKKRATRLMERQSERVRAALRDKEREVLQHQGLTDDDTVADSVSEEEIEDRLHELFEIRREEKLLVERRARLEEVAAKLLSRANKLKVSAEEMHKMQ